MPYMGKCSGFFHIYAAQGEVGVKPLLHPGNLKVAQRVAEFQKKYGCSITQIILGFFYHQPFTCVPLYGLACPEHIIDACETLDVPFTDADYEMVLAD